MKKVISFDSSIENKNFVKISKKDNTINIKAQGNNFPWPILSSLDLDIDIELPISPDM